MKLVLVALVLAAGAVSAQTLKSITVDVAQARVGQTVTATVGLESANAPNCGLRVRWGDGAVTERKISEAREMPFVTTHAYAKAGDYTVVADPGKVGASLGCVGKKASATVKVVAPPPPPAPSTSTSPPAVVVAAPPKTAPVPTCPDGWKLDARSFVKRTGAYTCTAKAGTAIPEKKVACQGELTYFENSKKGKLGCQS